MGLLPGILQRRIACLRDIGNFHPLCPQILQTDQFNAKSGYAVLHGSCLGWVRDEILDEFLAFIQDEEHAILLSSHITSDLEKVADYVTYLHRGRVAVSGAKDELLDTYGKLVCGRSELERVDPALLVGVRSGQFGCEALVKNRRAFARFHPELAVVPLPTLIRRIFLLL